MRRLTIYAHYDRANEVKRYTSFFLRAVAGVSERVDFVSTARLAEAELDKVRAHCARAFTKENSGYDFGMWQRALDDVDLTEWDELVLTNSSVFGPIVPLSHMMDEMADVPCDFWGATDNHDIDWHIQSYFLVFRRPVLASAAFVSFWRSVLPYQNKFQVIRSYEVGLTQFLLQHGFRGRAYLPAVSLFPRWPLNLHFKKRRLDATTFYPMRLLKRGMPFVKASLLRENPGAIDLRPIYRAIEQSGYDPSLIELDAMPNSTRLESFLEKVKRRP